MGWFETGTFGPPVAPFARRAFTVSLVRQLCVTEGGAYGHMEQVHCVLGFEPSDDLAAYEGVLWSDDCDSPEAFFDAVRKGEPMYGIHGEFDADFSFATAAAAANTGFTIGS